MEKIKDKTNGITYKIVNGTAYHEETKDEVIKVLEKAREEGKRIKLDYGYDNGQGWGETYGIIGYVSRSMGLIKVPLLVYNSTCFGGGAILVHRIIKIEYSNKKNGGVLYQHPNYKPYQN